MILEPLRDQTTSLPTWGRGLKLLLGIAPPDQGQGTIAYDILKGHEMVQERPE